MQVIKGRRPPTFGAFVVKRLQGVSVADPARHQQLSSNIKAFQAQVREWRKEYLEKYPLTRTHGKINSTHLRG